MRLRKSAVVLTAAILCLRFVSSNAEIPSGIPDKASLPRVSAWRWSIDRVLVRIEVKYEQGAGGSIWRSKTTYRFGFYSPSKRQAIWMTEEGNIDSSAFALPAEWSLEPIPPDFDDLPVALQKTSAGIDTISGATLYYNGGKPRWEIVVPNSDAVIVINPGSSVEEVLQESDFDVCMSNYNQKQYDVAFGCLKRLAESGLAAAQFNVAIMYIHGEGVSKSSTEAENWLKRAAAQNFPGAQDLLTKLQMLDFIKASEIADEFRKERDSYFQRGEESYKKGDYASALKYYKEASDRGSIEADYKLGLLYYNGQGTAKDAVKGLQLIRNAAKFGSSDAKNFLGKIHATQ